MTIDDLDIESALGWEEDLPRPQWDLIDTWIDTSIDAEEHDAAWTAVGRQWLQKLAAELGSRYAVAESESILMLAPTSALRIDRLLDFAGRCRQTFLANLPELIDTVVAGKQIVIVLKDREDYYRYLAPYLPEGEQGGSGGMHIREGYPHIVVHGTKSADAESTIAHEMTHAALMYLSLPAWIDEGLAQMYQHDMAERALLIMNEKESQAHKRWWGERGLESFWRGDGFHQAGKGQKLSYELAEVLVRLLVEEFRPRWFGWNKEPQRRLMAFLRGARAEDCGAAAATELLGLTLGEIAGWFLGPGNWAPEL